MKASRPSALEDFRIARQRAALQTILARLTQRSNELLPYDDTVRKLKLLGSAERGLQEVPIAAIVGTVGRYADFTRTFLPRQDSDAERWSRLRAAVQDGVALPTVELYQVGDAYFVRDGHHRISLARQDGATHVEAYVIEVRTRVPLQATDTSTELILKAEYADFLERTHLAEWYPEASLRVTELGQCARLVEIIEAHQRWMTFRFGRVVDFAETVRHWYTEVYVPLVNLVRERGLLRYFPTRTEADLYLWMAEYREELEKDLGWQFSPAAAAKGWVARKAPAASADRAGSKRPDATTERLFPNVLLPLSGNALGWGAFEQAVIVADHERAKIFGLHVTRTDKQKTSTAALNLQAEFNQRCQAAGRRGSLALERGQAARKICERALLADLVILPVVHPPSARPLARFSSDLRAIFGGCARPILAFSGEVSRFRHGLLAYDGTSKSNEALFLAAYLAGHWQSQITVVSALHARLTAEVQDQARAYLEGQGLKAEFALVKGYGKQSGRELLQQEYHERQCDFILMGTHNASLTEEFNLGSLVDTFLREMRCPVFVCR